LHSNKRILIYCNLIYDVYLQEMLEALDNNPLQTFYIPFPESSMFTDLFFPIRPDKSVGPVVSLISASISTDKTIIWYDHWEDGFDTDATNATTRSKTTEVWGDGNKTNGCQPSLTSCTDATDFLMAGTSFVIQNPVVVPRDRSVLRWDGGDKIQTTFPIAVTRGGYPAKPGSVLAGAVEVLDTDSWGTDFIAPVGINTPKASFEFSAFLFMAKEANTSVTLPDKTVVVLNEGESRLVKMNQSATLKSSKPIQVDLITGDIGSEYESRWFSLLDTAQWTTEYISPTGETYGRTKLVIYNPRPVSLTVTMDTLVNGTIRTANLLVPPMNYLLSPYVPDGSGARVKSTSTFLPLSITDSEIKAADNFTTGCQWFDWGFPLQPTADLTPQVLVAWGYVQQIFKILPGSKFNSNFYFFPFHGD
jgi:IgGFc binding protein